MQNMNETINKRPRQSYNNFQTVTVIIISIALLMTIANKSESNEKSNSISQTKLNYCKTTNLDHDVKYVATVKHKQYSSSIKYNIQNTENSPNNWLVRNKIYFETVSATLLSIMAILISLRQIFNSKEQNQIMRTQSSIMEIQKNIMEAQQLNAQNEYIIKKRNDFLILPRQINRSI